MMTTPTQILHLAEAAALLRAKLGPLRNWVNFLSDNIRGKQHVKGLTLKPCAKQHDGRSYRPIYAMCDIEKFIDEVLAVEPLARKAPIVPITLNIDHSRGWRVNKYKQDGSRAFSRIPNFGQRSFNQRTGATA
jgi:hypothetical protein